MPSTFVGKIAWTARNHVLVAQVESEVIDGISNLLEIADRECSASVMLVVAPSKSGPTRSALVRRASSKMPIA
jgi:hypothetical protein